MSSGRFIDQSQVYAQILYWLVFHKQILVTTIYKQVADLMMILMSQVMSQSTVNQQKKRSLTQAATLNMIILKNHYLQTTM